MLINEVLELHDVLKADQYIRLLKQLRAKANTDIKVTRIKNKVIQSWKRGMTKRKHYHQLLSTVNLDLSSLI